jgi:hypothetical protein
MGVYIISVTISLFFISSISGYAKYFLLYIHYAAFVIFVLYLLARYVFIRRPLRGREWKKTFKNNEFIYIGQSYLSGQKTMFESKNRIPYSFIRKRKDINSVTRLNFEGYFNTQFSVELHKIYRRNYSLAKKNKKIFMLIFNPLTNYTDPLGFSCIIPLCDASTRAYLDGNIRDSDFNADYITREGEKAASIILFSFHVDRAYSKDRSIVSASSFGFLFQFLMFHLAEIARVSLADPSTPIYVQAEKGTIIDFYKHLGFEPIDFKTADGCGVMCTTLEIMRQRIRRADLAAFGTSGQVSG